ncbi:MAG: monooxygenase, partial [Rhodobacteraceae bacterium]
HEQDEVAFAAYQQARRDRCEKIVDAATKNARNYHLSGAPRTLGHLALRAASRFAPERLVGRFDWIYGHDVTRAE